MAKNIIELNHIHVNFQQDKKDLHAVNDVTVHIQPGEIFGIAGYSGAGKSTLVRTINLLQTPTSGEVIVDGDTFFSKTDNGAAKIIDKDELRSKRREIGMIFQHFNLLQEQTVLKNIEFALKHSNLDKNAIKERSQKLLDLVGLAKFANSYPSQLSGGQQQRVAIARALANKPKILISDEATSALDPKNTNQILDLLKDIQKKLGLTVILITHEMDAIKRIADQVAIMDKGKLIEQGSLFDIFVNSTNPITRQFTGGSFNAIYILKKLHMEEQATDQDIIQLTYISDDAISEPVVVQLYRKFNVEASIIYSNIEVLGAKPVGTVLLALQSKPADRKQAIDYLKGQDIKVNVINTEEATTL